MKVLVALAFVAAILGSPAFAQSTGAHKYHAGQRVEYVDYGKWFKAVIVKVREDGYAPYRVHPIGYETTADGWVPESYIRAAGAGSTQPVPGGASGEANDVVLRSMRAGASASGPASARASALRGGSVAAKSYHCVMFITDHLVDAAPFTINPGGRYTDRDGVHGTYTVSGGVITFHGGNYNGQRAEYETGNGRPNVHFIGPSGRKRGVIDCD